MATFLHGFYLSQFIVFPQTKHTFFNALNLKFELKMADVYVAVNTKKKCLIWLWNDPKL